MPRSRPVIESIQRSELVERMYRKSEAFSRDDIKVATSVILEGLAQALARGQEITVRGFGKLFIRVKPACAMRNPKTGEPVDRPRVYVRFKSYPPLQEALNARRMALHGAAIGASAPTPAERRQDWVDDAPSHGEQREHARAEACAATTASVP